MIDRGEIVKYLAKESCTSSLADSLSCNEDVDSCDTDSQYNLGLLEDESNVDFDEINNDHYLNDEEHINDDIHDSEDEEDNIKDNNMYDEINGNKSSTVEGTSISVPDFVYGCHYISAACAMQYNKKGLCHDMRGTPYVAPLKEMQLGTCLLFKPIPSPNQTLVAHYHISACRGCGSSVPRM
jgi:hypothetical protein